MDGPGVIGSDGGIGVPELGLEELSAWVVEAAGVLAVVWGLTAQLGFGAMLKCALRWIGSWSRERTEA